MTKLDTLMLHDESWKPIYFFSQKVKITTSVGFQNTILPLLHTYGTQAVLATSGFPCITFLYLLAACCIYKPRWVFPGMGFCTNGSVGFFLFFIFNVYQPLFCWYIQCYADMLSVVTFWRRWCSLYVCQQEVNTEQVAILWKFEKGRLEGVL